MKTIEKAIVGVAEETLELVRRRYICPVYFNGLMQVLEVEFANDVELVKSDGLAAIRLTFEDAIEVRFRQDILASHPETYDRSWPADWWSAFKLRWLPKWLLKYWPARMERFHVEKFALYPSLPFPKASAQRYHMPVPRLEVNEDFYREDGFDED